MWRARNIFTNEYYGRGFGSIYDCQNYIDDHINMAELLEEYFNKNNISESLEKLLYKLKYGNIVKCYNTSQKRFCTGFDF